METMFPVGFGFRAGYADRLSHIIRECYSNAVNYKATKAFMMMAHHDNDDFLFFWHNGTSFVDMEKDILVNGCTANVSGHQGQAFQGAGLVACAIAASPRPQLLLVGSRLPDVDGFAVGTGCPKEGNRWGTQDETAHWWPIMQKLMGAEEEYKEYNVFYGFRFLYEHQKTHREDSRTSFKPKIMATIAYLARNPRPLAVYYCEQEIGFPYEPKKGKNKKAKMVSVHSARTSTKVASSGDIYRKAVTFPGYKEAFCLQDWLIECEPFSVKLENVTLNILKARVLVEYFPADKKSSWIANVRDCNIDGNYKKGCANESGAAPTNKTFLYCPWVYSWAKKHDPHFAHYARFEDNAVATYAQYRLFADMGLAYKSTVNDNGPFMVVNVFIDDVDLNDPYMLFDAMERKADFTFQHPDVVKILRQAAIAAKPKVPKDLKELCDRLYEAKDGDFPDLEMTGNGPALVKDCNRHCNVKVYDLDTGDILVKEPKSGEDHTLLFYHTVLGRLLTKDELQVAQSSRGLELYDLTQTYSFNNQRLEKNLAKLVDQLGLNLA